MKRTHRQNSSWIRSLTAQLIGTVVLMLPIAHLDPAIARSAPSSCTNQPLDPKTLQQALKREDITDAIRQVECGWKAQFEAYYNGKFTTQLLSAEAISDRLLQIQRLTRQKTALVYVLPSGDRLDLIVLSPNGKPIHRAVSTATAAARDPIMKAFRLGVVDPNSQPSDYLPAAQQLYEWMIAPIAQDLKQQNIDTLIFCLGTGFRSLPIAALHNGRQFLVEHYNLAIIPAFNLLDHRPTVLSGTQVLAMGASEFTSEEPLPAVPAELSAIAQQLWPGQVFLNEAFTLENLKRTQAKTPHGIVHLATHANISSQSAQESYIQFWDRSLRLDQMRELELRSPLVQLLVLSACRTAIGAPKAELGFAGLAIQSGAKAAIASLWSVNDSATFLLMTELYQRLKTAPIKAIALRQAQIALLNRQVTFQTTSLAQRSLRKDLPESLIQTAPSDLSHPHYWAAFTLIGNPW